MCALIIFFPPPATVPRAMNWECSSQGLIAFAADMVGLLSGERFVEWASPVCIPAGVTFFEVTEGNWEIHQFLLPASLPPLERMHEHFSSYHYLGGAVSPPSVLFRGQHLIGRLHLTQFQENPFGLLCYFAYSHIFGWEEVFDGELVRYLRIHSR